MPARRYLVSPQGAGFGFTGGLLPAATQGSAYSQNISGNARGGVVPYTFSEVTSTGPDTVVVSALGVITFTPTPLTLYVNAAGAYITNAAGAYLVT